MNASDASASSVNLDIRPRHSIVRFATIPPLVVKAGPVKLGSTFPLAKRCDSSMSLIVNSRQLLLPFAVMAGLLVVLTPLPPAVMDVILSLNIVMAVLIFLATVFVKTPLEFSIFPSLLLITTLSRLVLNVATTRLILTRGATDGLMAAGGVVRAFGESVAGNEIVVGAVIFSIIVIIQFVVITQGATRVSEVAARFALDGMPGRQMAIDADLNAGLINSEQASERRQQIARQADFYGAMDGASKFVRGDAIAGVLITVINVLGGLFIGIVQGGMGFADATGVFTRLTIGDGLVSQVPALLIALAAGLLITRSSEESELASDFIQQVFMRPQALAIAAVFLCLLSLTGLPVAPLLGLAAGCGLLANAIVRRRRAQMQKPKPVERKASPARRIEEYLQLDPLSIELGVGLLRLADPQRGGDLLAKIAALRTRAAADLGLVLPKVRIQDNVRLDDHGYRINIHNHRVATGKSLPHSVLAVDMGRATGVLDGIPDRDPATGRTAVWIDHSVRFEAESMGYVVLSAVDVLLTHLRTIAYRNADELLSRDATKHLVDELHNTSPTVVDELLPDVVRISDIQQVLKLLLREGVSIRPLATILETIGDSVAIRRDPWFLAERTRERLSRSISNALRDRNGVIYGVTLGDDLERRLVSQVHERDGAPCLDLTHREAASLIRALSRRLTECRQNGQPEIIVVDSRLRRPLRHLLESEWPDLHVVSYTEISRDSRLESTSKIESIDLRERVA